MLRAGRPEGVYLRASSSTIQAVKTTVKSVAFGVIAERLVKQAVSSTWNFNGFLATPRNGKYVVFHIQEFQQNC